MGMVNLSGETEALSRRRPPAQAARPTKSCATLYLVPAIFSPRRSAARPLPPAETKEQMIEGMRAPLRRAAPPDLSSTLQRPTKSSVTMIRLAATIVIDTSASAANPQSRTGTDGVFRGDSRRRPSPRQRRYLSGSRPGFAGAPRGQWNSTICGSSSPSSRRKSSPMTCILLLSPLQRSSVRQGHEIREARLF